jgi:hypothetical protein
MLQSQKRHSEFQIILLDMFRDFFVLNSCVVLKYDLYFLMFKHFPIIPLLFLFLGFICPFIQGDTPGYSTLYSVSVLFILLPVFWHFFNVLH